MARTAEQMIKTIRDHRGVVEVPVMAGCDVWHVVARKNDLIANIERAGRNPFYIVDVAEAVVCGTRTSVMTLDVIT